MKKLKNFPSTITEKADYVNSLALGPIRTYSSVLFAVNEEIVLSSTTKLISIGLQHTSQSSV